MLCIIECCEGVVNIFYQKFLILIKTFCKSLILLVLQIGKKACANFLQWVFLYKSKVCSVFCEFLQLARSSRAEGGRRVGVAHYFILYYRCKIMLNNKGGQKGGKRGVRHLQ